MEREREILEGVMKALARAGEPEGLEVHGLEWASNLFEDGGFTSLQLVDLSICIEDVFELDEFPIQEWIDAQAELDGNAFTVGSLVEACVAVIEGRWEPLA